MRNKDENCIYIIRNDVHYGFDYKTVSIFPKYFKNRKDVVKKCEDDIKHSIELLNNTKVTYSRQDVNDDCTILIAGTTKFTWTIVKLSEELN